MFVTKQKAIVPNYKQKIKSKLNRHPQMLGVYVLLYRCSYHINNSSSNNNHNRSV